MLIARYLLTLACLLLIGSVVAGCGGGGSTDGDTQTDGDTASDGDTVSDGDTATDGDTQTDGDTVSDGDTQTDGDTEETIVVRQECTDLCTALDPCGYLGDGSAWGVDMSACRLACDAGWAGLDQTIVSCLLAADGCLAVDDCLFVPRTECEAICERLDPCGLLGPDAAFGDDLRDCLEFCTTTWTELPPALVGCLSAAGAGDCPALQACFEAEAPQDCIDLCGRLDGCSLLGPDSRYGADRASCETGCGFYHDQMPPALFSCVAGAAGCPEVEACFGPTDGDEPDGDGADGDTAVDGDGSTGISSTSSNGPCKRDKGPGDHPESFSAEYRSGRIVAFHGNAVFNCCIETVVTAVSVLGSAVTIDEREEYGSNGPCNCVCPYDVTTEIEGLAPGSWTIIFAPSGVEAGRAFVEVPDGRIHGFGRTGCLNGKGGLPGFPETVEATVSPGDIRIRHQNGVFNCCLEDIGVEASVAPGEILVSEREVAPAPCHCICPYTLDYHVGPLAPGSYRLAIETNDAPVWSGDITVP